MTELNIDSNPSLNIPRDVMTSLPDGTKVRKDDLRVDACGTIDELNSYLGLLITEVPVDLIDELQTIQMKLFAVGAVVMGVQQGCHAPGDEDIALLKSRIADFKEKSGAPNTFVLPGGCSTSALAHVCRTICRRAERQIVAAEQYDMVPFMNRLSTYLFYLARYLNLFYRIKEIYI